MSGVVREIITPVRLGSAVTAGRGDHGQERTEEVGT